METRPACCAASVPPPQDPPHASPSLSGASIHLPRVRSSGGVPEEEISNDPPAGPVPTVTFFPPAPSIDLVPHTRFRMTVEDVRWNGGFPSCQPSWCIGVA